MFKKSYLGMAVAFTLAIPAQAFAEVETSVILKNETAVFLKDSQRTGEATSMLDNSSGDKFYKFENSAKIFFNGDVGEDSSWHGELNIVHDARAISGYKGHQNYTQRDWLRELYIDTSAGNWDFRVGKQQVVWGTADGIKLLDIINPTDFSEFNQNGVEDARIPVWMINAERSVGDNSNVQLIISQAQENKIAGLNQDGDADHPFIMKGVDTITGKVNGFLNIAPALGNTAATFNGAAMGGGFTGGQFTATGLNLFAGLTVDGFASGSWDVTTPGLLNPGAGAPDASLTDPTNMPGFVLLNNFAQNGFTGAPGFPAGLVDPNGNQNVTNLMPLSGPNFGETSWNPTGATTSTFEYMTNATFATFNTFTGLVPTSVKPTGVTGMTSEYRTDYPATTSPNFGGRFRSSLDNGLNFSLNYFYNYSSNPDINMSLRDATTGNELTVQRAATTFIDSNGTPGPQANDTYIPNTSTNLTRAQARANWDLGNPTTILVHDGAQSPSYYGALDPTAVLASIGDGNPFNDAPTPGAGAPILRFTEEVHRVHSIGGSFDYAVDGLALPLVLRGEVLYEKNGKQPVVDKFLLSIGDITSALKMEDADTFKYVIGADVTVLTNMLVSAQFIQFRNLDYIDQPDRCVRQGDPSGTTTTDCSRYTADFATMSLTNGLQKAEENKEFYSLFLSKPFGESQLGRINNILIYEEGGGYWDRIDAEYSLTDEIILIGEVNMYWGDEDTTFGQFKNSSNAQIGVKWIME